MGVGDVFSSLGLGDISIKGIIDTALKFGVIFILLIVLGGIVMAFFIVRKRGKRKQDAYKVGWWEEVNERMEPTRMDSVEEIIIPGTPLRIFYNKERDLWLPRFTRGITKDLFYVLLTPTKQMVNFTIKSLSKDLKDAKLEYDHTDMLWAAENAREYIKKNYKDKGVKWWQAYQNTIATLALLMVMTFCFVLIIFFMRGIVKDLASVVGQIGKFAESACLRAQTSGITPA